MVPYGTTEKSNVRDCNAKGCNFIQDSNSRESFDPIFKLELVLHPILQCNILANPKDIVTPYKHLPQHPLILPILPFLRVGEFEVHVAVNSVETAVVFLTPFEFDDDVFARQVLQEGLGIDLHKKRLVWLLEWGDVGHNIMGNQGTYRHQTCHC